MAPDLPDSGLGEASGVAAQGGPFGGERDEAYAVGTMILWIRVAYSRSLKDKRQVLRPLKERLKARHNLAVAEIGHQDSRKDAVVVAATVAATARETERILARALESAQDMLQANLLDAELQLPLR